MPFQFSRAGVRKTPMRKYILLLCLLAVTCFAGDPGPKSKDVGRYRLLRAPVTVAVDKTLMQVEAVFKIDSVTGDTWMFKSGSVKGQVIERWVSIVGGNNTPVVEMQNGHSYAEVEAFLDWSSEHTNGWSGLDSKGNSVTYTPEEIEVRRRELEKEALFLIDQYLEATRTVDGSRDSSTKDIAARRKQLSQKKREILARTPVQTPVPQ